MISVSTCEAPHLSMSQLMNAIDWELIRSYDLDCTKRHSPMTTPPLSPSLSLSQEAAHTPWSALSIGGLISTTFYPGANHRSVPEDIVILARGRVLFFVNCERLLAVSDNHFRGLLSDTRSILPRRQRLDKGFPPDELPLLAMDEDSVVLDIILHAVYDIPCAKVLPTFASITTAAYRLTLYGIHPENIIVPHRTLYAVLLMQAPLHPLELYTCAAYLNLDALAIATSSYLLGYDIRSMEDEVSVCIGPIYLNRLLKLQVRRVETLKQLLNPPLYPHPLTRSCNFEDQKCLARAWRLATASLFWSAKPDLSATSINAAIRPLEPHLSCGLCLSSLRSRVTDIIKQWSLLKTTI